MIKNLFLPLAILSFVLNSNSENLSNMIKVPSGVYMPLYVEVNLIKNEKLKKKSKKIVFKRDKAKVKVDSFYIDTYPITNDDFKEFLKFNTEWSKSRVKKIFSDGQYLKNWNTDFSYDSKYSKAPVTYVSWYVANAYCQSLGKSLPTIAQWELAADVKSNKKLKEKIFHWYNKLSDDHLANVGSTFSNQLGIWDLNNLIWEWTYDFNTSLVTGDAREDTNTDTGLFCGGGALNATNFEDNTAFMREAMRSSLKAHQSSHNLGFRCVKNNIGGGK